MMGMPHGARIWLACGATDMRRGFDGLAALVQTQLAADPYAGHLFVFRGRRGNRLKILWYSGDGLNRHMTLPLDDDLRISRHAGHLFHRMSAAHFTSCRPGISRMAATP
jgi:transposase